MVFKQHILPSLVTTSIPWPCYCTIPCQFIHCSDTKGLCEWKWIWEELYLSFAYTCIFVGDPIITRGGLGSHKLVELRDIFVPVPSQDISYVVVILYIQCFEVRCVCSLCLCWWNCSSSLFKFSFRNNTRRIKY